MQQASTGCCEVNQTPTRTFPWTEKVSKTLKLEVEIRSGYEERAIGTENGALIAQEGAVVCEGYSCQPLNKNKKKGFDIRMRVTTWLAN